MTLPPEPRAVSTEGYWRRNLTYVGMLLVVWFVVSYGAGILFVEPLNRIRLPGTGVSPLANGMATAADWMSAASFISMAGLISFRGYDGSVYLMGWTGGYVLLALLLAPYLRKFGATRLRPLLPSSRGPTC